MPKGIRYRIILFLRKLTTLLLVSLFYLQPCSSPSFASEAQAASAVMKGVLSHPYRAPLLLGITGWINSPPLKLSDLKDKVILIEFWTTSCPYCRSALPYLNSWYKRYHSQGLLIIGVHPPKEEWENNSQLVQKTVQENNIHFPVALDGNFETWNNFGVEAWPATFLIDRTGNVVFVHYGASDFEIIENNIRSLLGL